MASPIPKPTHLKMLAGNPGHRTLNQNEPQPKKGIKKCPKWIEDYAKEIYEELSQELNEIGVLTTIDQSALVALAIQLANQRYAWEQIGKVGYIVKTPSGYVQTNPFVGLLNHSTKLARGLMQEFGMTPAARTRIQVSDAEKAADPFIDFMNRKKKA